MSLERSDSRLELPPFKHLDDPSEWQRNTPTRAIPSHGDFVVLSVNPVASVAHLDNIARIAAQEISTRKYLAVIYEGYGLPIHTKPTNSHDVAFIRRGFPNHLTRFDTIDMCIPVWPNTTHGQLREPVHPVQPLPWSDCYIDTTLPFPVTCRVTTAKRDYTPVLPLSMDDILHMYHCFEDDGEARRDLKYRIMDGSLDAIACLPLPPSPVSAYRVPLPPSPPSSPKTSAVGSVIDDIDAHQINSPLDSTHPDGISIIASDDSDGAVDDDGASLSVMLHFEDFINDTGDVDDPVVDVWYDLGMISDVADPTLFLDELKEIKKIINDAEARLGIERKPTTPAQWSEIPPGSEQLSYRPGSRKSKDPSSSRTEPNPSILQRVRMYLSSFTLRSQRLLLNVRKKVKRLASKGGWACYSNSTTVE